MELYQLQYFRAIATFGSMAAAAAFLNVTQPALSYAINQLERELNTKLFTRRNGKLLLNTSGQLLLSGAEPALRQLDQCIDQVKADGATDSSRIYVGISYNGIISQALTEFITKNPDVHLYETLPYFDVPVHTVDNGAVDFLVTYEQYAQQKLVQLPLYKDRLVALMTPDHPLANRDSLCINDLSCHRIIFNGPPWTLLALLGSDMNDIAPEAIGLNTLYEGTDDDISLELAKRGMGILLMPESELTWKLATTHGNIQHLQMCQIPLNITQTISLTYAKNKKQRPMAQKLIDFLLDFYHAD